MRRILMLFFVVVFLFGFFASAGFAQRPQRPGAVVSVKPAEPAKAAEAPAVEPAKPPEAPKPETPTPPPVEPAKPEAGALAIVTDRLPDAELGRHYEPELQARGGKEPYGWSTAEGSEVEDVCDARFCFRPEKEGVLKVVLEVTDSSDPAQKATKAFTLKVGPRQFHGEDITALETALARKADLQWAGNLDGRLDTLERLLTSNELDDRFKTNRFIKLEADLKEAKETIVSLERVSWFLTVIILVFVVALATALIIWRRRASAPPSPPAGPRAEGGAPETGPGGGRADPRIFEKLTGIVVLVGLLSVCTTYAASPASTTTADPAKPALTGLSVSADYVLQNAVVQDPKTKDWKPRFYNLTLVGKNLEGVEAILLPTGCSIEGEPKAEKARVTARFRCDSTAPEGRNQAGLKIKGEDVFPPDDKFFLIFSQTANSLVEYLRGRASDPAARHDLQARFQLVYGREEGQKRYDAYRRRPTHQAVQELEAARQRKLLEDAANVATTRIATLEAKVASLEASQANLRASVEDGLNKANAKTENVEQQVAELRSTWGEELGRTNGVVRELGGVVAELGDQQRVKKGGFLGLGGRKPPDPKVRERVERALAKLK